MKIWEIWASTWICFFFLSAAVLGEQEGLLCEPPNIAHLQFETDMGSIVARLIERAAPDAVRRVVRLSEGPTFHPDLTAGQDDTLKVGYYDGLLFERARPHVEIVTGLRPGSSLEIVTELDAVSLGLDKERIQTLGEAMDVAQLELSPVYKAEGLRGEATELLTQWMQRLYATQDASFLVGVSRMTINEALGYIYTRGLESQPVNEGALMLMPRSPQFSDARLGIALMEMPQQTGRVMVIGHVIEGLETARKISTRPLANPGVVQDRHRPVDPVRIESIRRVCRTPP